MTFWKTLTRNNMNLIIKTEDSEFVARELWSDSMDSFIETKLDIIENPEDEKLDKTAVVECYRHFHDKLGDARPRLVETEDEKSVTIRFPEDENWEITCFLR